MIIGPSIGWEEGSRPPSSNTTLHTVPYTAVHELHWNRAGVTVSFLDQFNGTLGYARLLNTNDAGTLGTYDISIDNTQHYYENTLADFASLAGLDTSDPTIDSVSLKFWAQGQSYYSAAHSQAQVWFDDVCVRAVPIPSAILLLGSGMMGLLAVMRRKHQL